MPTAVSPDIAEESQDLDDAIPSRGYQMLPMIGLGGSAGSIKALIQFFQAMPADSGMAFVVILHLSPDHESVLDELIGRATKMPVVKAQDGVKVEANCVYVIPPGKQITSSDGTLRLEEMDRTAGRRVAVDLFFRTLADSHGPHSAAIILSGADGDGAIGIQRIKERGGLTIAQDPDEADHSSMPSAAIATGMVDWVLPVARMPGRLVQYQANEKRLRLPPAKDPEPTSAPVEAGEMALREVLVFLHERTGRDFSCYKRGTVLRRIARRMQLNDIEDMAGYFDFLRLRTGESGALQQDLLVPISNFFRDRDAFDALERHIPDLFRGKGVGDTVRVWVPACANGEEAYSIAMLLCEHASTLAAPPTIQIFATDLDEELIATARAGVFPSAITADVSEARLQRFFVKDPLGHRVHLDLRAVVLFAVQDLLNDAPFSRLDLLSCRNLLISLTDEARKTAFGLFHFALRDGGRLFLGASEIVDEEAPLFRAVDKKHRIYEPIPSPRARVPRRKLEATR